MTHDGADDQQENHGDEGEKGEGQIHAEHLKEGHNPEEQGIGQHENARAKAVLYRLQVVCEVGHERTHLVDLVVLAGEILTAVEHPSAEIGLHLDARAKEADTPEEPPDGHADDDEDHGQADFVQQKVHIKGVRNAVHQNPALVHAVDNHLVQLRHFQLQNIHQYQRKNAQQKCHAVAQIVAVYVLAENHTVPSFSGCDTLT